jgi:hypothetical protein
MTVVVVAAAAVEVVVVVSCGLDVCRHRTPLCRCCFSELSFLRAYPHPPPPQDHPHHQLLLRPVRQVV